MIQDPIGLWGGNAFYVYVHDVNSYLDPLGWSGNIFRGDDFYNGGDIGTPLGGDADITTPWEHVRRESNGETSKFTSFATKRNNAMKFTKKGKVSKVSMDDIRQLEADGVIKVHTPESVRDAMKNSGNKKLRKDANNVFEIMKKNNEVLIEGTIPSNKIKCG